MDPLLEEPPIPRAARALWDAFLSLASSRQTGFAPQALTYVDVEAWCRLNRVTLTPWELDTLMALDAAALSVAAKKKAT